MRKDTEQAVQWYRKAAGQGGAQAQQALADLGLLAGTAEEEEGGRDGGDGGMSGSSSGSGAGGSGVGKNRGGKKGKKKRK